MYDKTKERNVYYYSGTGSVVTNPVLLFVFCRQKYKYVKIG